jgi:hypothetical protein
MESSLIDRKSLLIDYIRQLTQGIKKNGRTGLKPHSLINRSIAFLKSVPFKAKVILHGVKKVSRFINGRRRGVSGGRRKSSFSRPYNFIYTPPLSYTVQVCINSCNKREPPEEGSGVQVFDFSYRPRFLMVINKQGLRKL